MMLFDHVGYEPDIDKVILLEAARDTTWTSVVAVRMPSGEVVADVEPVFVGGVEGWSCGPWWSLDVSFLHEPGRYAIRWQTVDDVGQSEGFTIADQAHGDQLVSDIVHYIKGQRCSGIWDRADRSAPRVGDGLRRDVHGGWYDASGDYSKYLSHLSYANYLNPQQTPLVVWALARVWHRSADTLPSLLRERVRDEALHGADWLVRMQDPEGFWYTTVFDGWSKDPEQRELASYRTQLGHKGSDYQAGWRQGGGMAAAALALASTLGDGPDHTAEEYRATGLRGFEHLRVHGLAYLDDGCQNVIDDTCALLAAIELVSAFDGAAPTSVHEELEHRLDRMLARRRATGDHVWLCADEAGERSWFHASDEGLPGLTLLRLGEVLPDHPRAGVARELASELVAAQLALGESLANPFGYPPHWIVTADEPGRSQWFYPHRNESGYWWQGENARLGSLAALALSIETVASAHRAAQRWIAWILGANPFDVCMLQGHGRNNPPYAPGFHNAPGGVCNGITSGFDDEADIAFRPMPAVGMREHSWRWGEQWMPHAAWLLLALVVAATTEVAADQS
jgi:hypothetical protein